MSAGSASAPGTIAPASNIDSSRYILIALTSARSLFPTTSHRRQPSVRNLAHSKRAENIYRCKAPDQVAGDSPNLRALFDDATFFTCYPPPQHSGNVAPALTERGLLTEFCFSRLDKIAERDALRSHASPVPIHSAI